MQFDEILEHLGTIQHRTVFENSIVKGKDELHLFELRLSLYQPLNVTPSCSFTMVYEKLVKDTLYLGEAEGFQSLEIASIQLRTLEDACCLLCNTCVSRAMVKVHICSFKHQSCAQDSEVCVRFLYVYQHNY